MTLEERAEEMFCQGGTPEEIRKFFLFHLHAAVAEERAVAAAIAVQLGGGLDPYCCQPLAEQIAAAILACGKEGGR